MRHLQGLLLLPVAGEAILRSFGLHQEAWDSGSAKTDDLSEVLKGTRDEATKSTLLNVIILYASSYECECSILTTH